MHQICYNYLFKIKKETLKFQTLVHNCRFIPLLSIMNIHCVDLWSIPFIDHENERYSLYINLNITLYKHRSMNTFGTYSKKWLY